MKFLNKTDQCIQSWTQNELLPWLMNNTRTWAGLLQCLMLLRINLRQDIAGAHVIWRAICKPGCAGEWAWNSACVIPTVCVQQSLSFRKTPMLWWDTSALRPIPSLPPSLPPTASPHPASLLRTPDIHWHCPSNPLLTPSNLSKMANTWT